MPKAKFYLSLITLCLVTTLNAQSVLGKWKSIDDETGKAKSIVEIYERNGKVHGKIIQLFREKGEEQDPTCVECKGKYANKKIIGLEIIQNLTKDDDTYEDGTILDPENGNTYDCKLWVDADTPDKLNVRGYVALFYRTQTWIKVKD